MIVDAKLAQVGERESIADVARVLGRASRSRSSGGRMVRTGSRRWPRHAGVPVVNALTDDYHPCQILADLQTILEHKGRLAGLTMAYVGDGANNMAHSYLLGGALAGHARPHRHTRRPPAKGGRSWRGPQAIAATTGGSITVTDDPYRGVHGADVVITDTWVSMGMEVREGRPATALAHPSRSSR
jgi:ornithine carbamoyltransferase